MNRKLTLVVTLIIVFAGSLGAAVYLTQVQEVRRKEYETIHLRVDGSIDPSTTPISKVDNVTYTFTNNIYSVARMEIFLIANKFAVQK